MRWRGCKVKAGKSSPYQSFPQDILILVDFLELLVIGPVLGYDPVYKATSIQ